MKILYIIATIYLLLAFVNLQSQSQSNSVLKCPQPDENYDVDTKACIHKDVFPMFLLEYIGTFVLIIAMAFASAGGVGGGGLLVPLCIIFYSFEANAAVPISNMIIFFSSISSFLFNINDKHPDIPGRSVIDFDAVRVSLPTAILGTFIGVQIKKVMPSALTVLLLTIVMIVLTFQITKKSINLYKKEKSIRRVSFLVANSDLVTNLIHKQGSKNRISTHDENVLNTDKDKTIQLMNTDVKENKYRRTVTQNDITIKTLQGGDLVQTDVKIISRLDSIINKEQSKFPFTKHLPIFLIITCIVLVSLLRPAPTRESIADIQPCSAIDLSLLVGFIILCAVVSFFTLHKVNRDYNIKQSMLYEFRATEIKWTNKNLTNLALKCSIGGCLGGMLGIGGGLVFNPVLLGAGEPPKVATATGMYMVLYTSGAATLQFLISNEINIHFAILFSIMGTIGTLVGLSVIRSVVKRTKRSSLLVICLALVSAASAIVMPIFGTMRVIDDVNEGLPVMEFGNYC